MKVNLNMYMYKAFKSVMHPLRSTIHSDYIYVYVRAAEEENNFFCVEDERWVPPYITYYILRITYYILVLRITIKFLKYIYHFGHNVWF